jgi:hypothetical protein
VGHEKGYRELFFSELHFNLLPSFIHHWPFFGTFGSLAATGGVPELVEAGRRSPSDVMG